MAKAVNYEALAKKTETWMKNIGAIWVRKNEIAAEIPKHVTVEEWAEQFEFSIDENTGKATQSTARHWQHTKLSMIQLGIPVAVHEFRGHYIGESGDQASNVIMNVQHSLARLQRAMLHLEGIRHSGEWINCQEKFKGKLLTGNLKTLLDNTKGVCPDKYNGVPSDDLVLLMEK